MTRYRVGDQVELVSVPIFDNDAETDAEGVGQVWPVDKVRLTAADGSVWYDVAGWCVKAENLSPAT